MHMSDNQNLDGIFDTIGKAVKKGAKVAAGAGATYATGNPAFLASSVGALKDSSGKKVSFADAFAAGAIPGAQNSAYPYPLGFPVPASEVASSAGYQTAYQARNENLPLFIAGGAALLVLAVAFSKR